jgi:hypothetical protein
MSRPIEQVIADFEAFRPSTDDFNYAGRNQLTQLCNELLETDEPIKAVHAILHIIERFPDDDFGTPGALVHTLEDIPGYESYVLESVERQPAPLSVQMVSRMLNSASSRDEKHRLFRIIQAVLEKPTAPESAKEMAQMLIDYHQSNSSLS